MLLGATNPVAMLCCRLGSGNFPIAFKAAEVIQADNVTSMKGPGHPFDPPVVAQRLNHVPAVKRISPTLAGNAEGVRGHARNQGWLKIIVKIKQSTIAPSVGAVIVHKDRDIANDL